MLKTEIKLRCSKLNQTNALASKLAPPPPARDAFDASESNPDSATLPTIIRRFHHNSGRRASPYGLDFATARQNLGPAERLREFEYFHRILGETQL